jgi:hypothetical protein
MKAFASADAFPILGRILLDKNERYEYIVLVLEEREKRSSI